MSVLCSPTRSERRLNLLVWFVFLRDGVTLWGVKCVLRTLLIAIEGSHAKCFCLRLVSPLVRRLHLPLCSFSLCGFFLLCGLSSLGIFSLPRLVGPLDTVSSFFFPSLFSLDASSVSLCLLCSSLRIWVVLRSLCGLLCSLWTYSLVGSSREILF